MEKYVFSGGLTRNMVKYLTNIAEFKPMDVLVTQLDRSSIRDMIEYAKEGVVASLFIDSGAYSYYTGRISNIDVDEYIEFVNSIDEYVFAIAQVDTIPGKFGKPKTAEDYIQSSKASWDNFLYMYDKLKSPNKLVPVFHYGEPFTTLQNMLDWRDDHGNPVGIIGLSPANDSPQAVKNRYLTACYDYIKKSSNPAARTHLFGMTSLKALQMFPCYSADSVSHRLRTGYNKVYTRKWGTISLSDKARTSKVKSNMSFLETCDSITFKEFEDLISHYGLTIDQLKTDNSARVAVDIVETQKAIADDYAYDSKIIRTSKRLF